MQFFISGGYKFFVPDQSNSNNMIDVFSRISSVTGDIFQQWIQVRISSILYLQMFGWVWRKKTQTKDELYSVQLYFINFI